MSQIALPIAALSLLLAAAPPPLAPSSKWGIDYGAQRYTLYRKFGEGKSGVILRFEQTAPQGNISVLMSGGALRSGNGRRDNRLEFQPLGGSFAHDGLSLVTTEGQTEAVYWSSALSRGKWGLIPDEEAQRMVRALPPGQYAGRLVPGFDPVPIKWVDRDWSVEDAATREGQYQAFDERAARVATVALNPGKRGSVTLLTGSLSAPLQALEKCARNSLKDWGIDVTVEDKIVERARPIQDTSKLLTSADYPQQAIIAGKESRLEVWLNLDAGGRVASCRVISTFASPEINDRMCKLVQQRQTFVPAKTAKGDAVPSYYVQSFYFRLAD
ncbi:MAG: energy transducer TonB [Sphingomicrobium sp.]